MFNSKVNYYEVLKVSSNASDDEIKKSFRTLASQNHPDKNPGNSNAEQTFKSINEAYQVLSDPNKRAEYDAFLNGHSGASFMGFDDFMRGGHGIDDIIRDFFNQQHQQQQAYSQSRIVNVQEKITLTFAEAVYGCKKDLMVNAPSRCLTCNGTNVKPNSKVVTCPTCNGTGNIKINQGFMHMTMTCNACQGTCVSNREICGVCNNGIVSTKKAIKITVPPGIDNQQTIKITYRPASKSETNWDLYVAVNVKNDTNFSRKKLNLQTSVDLSYKQLLAGYSFDLELLNGVKKTVKVPAMTEPGTIISFANEGILSLDNSGKKGDLNVQVKLKMPKNNVLSDEVLKLIDELESKLSLM